MEDLSKLTDEELDAMIAASEAQEKQPDVVDVKAMSDEELDAAIKVSEQDEVAALEGKYSQGQAFGTGLGQGATLGFADELAGAGGGLGQALGVFQGLEGEPLTKRLSEAGKAFGEGYGEVSKNERQELSDIRKAYPKTAIASEVVGSLATAPLAALGALGKAGALTKGAVFGGLGAAGQSEADSALGVVGDTALGAGLGAGVEKVTSSVAPFIKKQASALGTKIGSTLTGISEKNIANYAKRADEIAKRVDSASGDVSLIAERDTESLLREVANAKNKLSSEIGKVLKSDAGQKKVSLAGLVKSIEDRKLKLDPKIEKNLVSELDELLEKEILPVIEDGTDITIERANILKRKLQGIASGGQAYQDQNKFFNVGSEFAKGARDAAKVARDIVELGLGEGTEDLVKVRGSNSKLATLHNIERKVNKNLLTPGKSLAMSTAAGDGANKQAERTLALLDQITGGSSLQRARDLASGRTFMTDLQITPVDTTGKSFTRMNLGRIAAGGALGYLGGGDLESAGTGAILSSPVTLKAAIQSGRFVAPGLTSTVLTPTITNWLKDKIVDKDEDGNDSIALAPEEVSLVDEEISKNKVGSSVEKAKALSNLRARGSLVFGPNAVDRSNDDTLMQKQINDAARSAPNAQKRDPSF